MKPICVVGGGGYVVSRDVANGMTAGLRVQYCGQETTVLLEQLKGLDLMSAAIRPKAPNTGSNSSGGRHITCTRPDSRCGARSMLARCAVEASAGAVSWKVAINPGSPLRAPSAR